MRLRGITLLELLVVIAIIALVIALMLPVIASARKRSYETTCMNNLHQLGVAINLYINDYGELAPRLYIYAPYVKEQSLYRCPSDPWASRSTSSRPAGANIEESALAHFTISYHYIFHPVCIPDGHFYRQCLAFKRLLNERDPNHGVAYCLLHGNHLGSPNDSSDAQAWYYDGLILRLRKDSSVQRVPQGVPITWCGQNGYRSEWRLVTDAPCPEELGFLYCGCGRFRDTGG